MLHTTAGHKLVRNWLLALTFWRVENEAQWIGQTAIGMLILIAIGYKCIAKESLVKGYNNQWYGRKHTRFLRCKRMHNTSHAAATYA